MLFSPSPLVTTAALRAALGSPLLRIFDGSWYLGGARDAKKEYLSKHIPGALFFDIDDVCMKPSPLPHMLPRAADFATAASDMGVTNEMHVVVYNQSPASFSAARVWWTFRAFGHRNVYVLQGGLPQWEKEGGATESGPVSVQSTRQSAGMVVQSHGCVASGAWKLNQTGFQANLQPAFARTWRGVREVAEGGSEAGAIVDARPLDRFAGRAPEPRPGLRMGHVPGSKCLPVAAVLAPGDFASFREPEDIKEAFAAAGIDLSAPGPLVTTCGSGVMAAALTMAAELAGRDAASTPVYDGSWAEWGGREDLPIAGEAAKESV